MSTGPYPLSQIIISWKLCVHPDKSLYTKSLIFDWEMFYYFIVERDYCKWNFGYQTWTRVHRTIVVEKLNSKIIESISDT